MSGVRLGPFEAGDLPLVKPWFENVETQRWLGGPGWPNLILDLAAHPLSEFRGAVETGRYAWVAWDGDRPVGLIDCGTTDRWTTWEGGPGGRGVIASIAVPSANISYVVDPTARRCGYGSAMLRELLDVPALAHVELFAAGIEPGNTASIRCARSAGFDPLTSEPDWEGIIYHLKRRMRVSMPQLLAFE